MENVTQPCVTGCQSN